MSKEETIEKIEKWIDELDLTIAHECEDKNFKFELWALVYNLKRKFKMEG